MCETKQHVGVATTALERVDQSMKVCVLRDTALQPQSATAWAEQGRPQLCPAPSAASNNGLSCWCRWEHHPLAVRLSYRRLGGPLDPTLPSPTSASVGDGEQWCLAMADHSQRLNAVTKTRDNAVEKTARRQQRWAEPRWPR
jgi:hypothetical protein